MSKLIQVVQRDYSGVGFKVWVHNAVHQPSSPPIPYETLSGFKLRNVEGVEYAGDVQVNRWYSITVLDGVITEFRDAPAQPIQPLVHVGAELQWKDGIEVTVLSVDVGKAFCKQQLPRATCSHHIIDCSELKPRKSAQEHRLESLVSDACKCVSDESIVDEDGYGRDTQVYGGVRDLIKAGYRKVSESDYNHLSWVLMRMCEVHGENPNVDFMIKVKEILERLK